MELFLLFLNLGSKKFFEIFFIGGQERGEIIPFPVFKISFGLIKTFCKRSFSIGGQEVGEIIPFPVWITLFPVFKTSLGFVFES